LEEAGADGGSRGSNRAAGAMATLQEKGPPAASLRTRFFRVGHRGIGPIHAKIGGIWKRPAPTPDRGDRTAPPAQWQPCRKKGRRPKICAPDFSGSVTEESG
jgi:hypothetical protein